MVLPIWCWGGRGGETSERPRLWVGACTCDKGEMCASLAMHENAQGKQTKKKKERRNSPERQASLSDGSVRRFMSLRVLVRSLLSTQLHVVATPLTWLCKVYAFKRTHGNPPSF